MLFNYLSGILRPVLLLCTLAMLNACAKNGVPTISTNNIKENLHHFGVNGDYEGHYKVGAPYIVKEKIYYPEEKDNYQETGYASWYGGGDNLHGKITANGDKFNKKALTAAHRTLPLPSVAKITNLENGLSVIVMINDRGPFTKNRIIDVSERAAEILNMKRQGVAKVRVEYIPHASKELLAELRLSDKVRSISHKTNTTVQTKKVTAKKSTKPSKNRFANNKPK